MHSKQNKGNITVIEICVLGALGAIMYVTKVIMQFLPNIHLLGVIIIATTVVFRYKALYSIYTYVLLEGIFGGFNVWWIPYLYIWTVLWGVTMLLPKNLPVKWQIPVYCIVCALHGLLFGTLYAPVQALFFGLNFKGMIAWIVAGLPFDAIHGISNLICGLLICPLIAALKQTRIRN